MSERKRICVLKGGWCAEREISLVSGEAAAKALREEGFEVEELDVTRNVYDDLKATFGGVGPDAVFNGLHGPFGEDGQVQALLELLEIPYTHSGVLASALAMDKPKAKHVLECAGLPVPETQLIPIAELDGSHPRNVPYVMKPIADGSSFGVKIITDKTEPGPVAAEFDQKLFGDTVLVEPFIPGRELTVAVMGKLALGVTEIVPKSGFYDFEAKYADGGSDHVLPADIPENIAEAAQEMAVTATLALGARGLSRTDFRWDEKRGIKGLFILEVNTQPGLTPTSLAPEQAQASGIGFGALTRWMIEDASCLR